MKQKTTTAKSKQTSKTKTKATASKPTGAKVARLQRKPTAWEQALQNCITSYDQDARLKERHLEYSENKKREREVYGSGVFFVPKNAEPIFIDTVTGIHPDEKTLAYVQKHIDELTKALQDADKKQNEAIAEARSLDGDLARQEAETAIIFDSDGAVKKAEQKKRNALLDAGALELSLRAPIFCWDDITKLSRNNEAEKAIFQEAVNLLDGVLPHLRRSALDATTQDERMKILQTQSKPKAKEEKYPHGLPWKLLQKADGKFWVIWKGVEYQLRIGRWYEAILHIGRTGAKEFEIMEHVPAGSFKNNEFMNANFKSKTVSNSRTKLIRKT